MKKLLCALIASLLLLSSAAVLPVLAEEPTGQVTPSDWIITEICPDQRGREGNTNGYTEDVSADPFEFIEIYNNSGRELDLYDYAVIYNAATRDNELFENQITEYTPFKPGDYLDGSDLVPTEPTQPFGDLSNKPVNPESCMVAPGEVVVLWMVYLEAYQARFNGGKGMSIADFRAHWDIPEGVKVIAVDANGNTKNGGHSKNFNVKNSAVGTYGIVKQSDELDAACNTDEGLMVNGPFWESEHLVCWATVDYTDMLLDGKMDNVTYNFTWDFGGYGAIDQAYTYYYDENYVFDARRGYLLTMSDDPTAGKLNAIQKMTLGVELSEGESFTFDSFIMYQPLLDEKIEGFKINGKLYDNNQTFTAPAAGVYTYDFFFEGDDETEAPTETPTDEATEAPTDEVTEAPTEEATQAPSDTSSEPITTAASEGGCGSVMGLAMVPCLAVAALFIRKKRED